MFTTRQIDIIAYLINQEHLVSSEQIADHFGLSKKTLKNEIEEIQGQLGEQGEILFNKKGYKLEFLSDTIRKCIYLEIKDYGGKSSLGIRPSVFALYLLFLKDYVSMQSLADTFYLSKTAVALEILTLRRWIERYDGLELEVSNVRGIKICAEEKRKRAYCAKFGTLYAFRNLPFGDEISDTFENYLQGVQTVLCKFLTDNHYIITGEEFRKNSRFIAISILRSRMGYEREGDSNGKRDEFTEQIFRLVDQKFHYRLNSSELSDILEMLKESSTLTDQTYPSMDMEEKFEQLESRIRGILGISDQNMFVDREAVIRHLFKVELRAKAGNVAINHYNEEIVERYPLEVHIMYRLYPEIFGRKVTKETSFLALFLGTGLNLMRDQVSVLLVSDQNQGVINQIKAAIYLCGTSQIRKFFAIPGYVFEKEPEIQQRFDILLTTDQETLLIAPMFYQIPQILSHTDAENLNLFLKQRISHIRGEKRQDIKERYLKIEELTPKETDDLEQIIGYSQDQFQSYHTIGGKKIYICRISPAENTEIRIYNLKKPVVFQYKKIRKIIFARFRQGEENIFDFFSTISELLTEE